MVSAVILVVEDQPGMLRSIQMGLEVSGYEVVTAKDGVEALALLERQPVDLILADIAMPRMNGYQLHEEILRNPRWALIPFVFLSARALDSDVRYGKALGVDDYLTKPFLIEDLLAVVAGRLRRAEQLAQATAALSAPDGGAGTQVSPYTGAAAGMGRGDPAPTRGGAAQDVQIGALRISPGQHRVWLAGAAVELSLKEFALLEYLARRPGEAVSLTELCRVTHGLETTAVDAGNLLYPLVRSLRRRLGYAAGEMGCIESVRGVGYRLAPPE